MAIEISCPSCRKPNEEVAACIRCGCELGDLVAIASSAAKLCRYAEKILSSGMYDKAALYAANSWNLRHTAESARIAFLSCFAARDFEKAVVWHSKIRA